MSDKLSKDIENEQEAIGRFHAIGTEKEVRAFVKGDQRDAVMDAAAARINELKAGEEGKKQGETDRLTKHTGDFKGPGVEGMKSAVAPPSTGGVGEGAASKSDQASDLSHSALRTPHLSGEAVVDALDKTALKQTRDREIQAREAEKKNEGKSAELIRRAKSIVTCDDAIEQMRKEGKIV